MEKLPHEILVTILAHTRPPDTLAMACVSKFFHRVALDPILHRSASFQGEWYVTPKFVTRYITRFKKSLVSLDLEQCYWLKPAPLAKAICRCQDLVHLRLIGCNISYDFLSEILSTNKKLKSLSWSLPVTLYKKTYAKLLLTKTISAADELFRKFSTSTLNSVELQLPDRVSNSYQPFKEHFQITQHILSSMHTSEIKVTFRKSGFVSSNEHIHVKLKERSIDLEPVVGNERATSGKIIRFIIESALTSATNQGDLEILVAPSFISKKCKIPLNSVTKGYLTKADLSCWSNDNTAEMLTFLTSGCHLTHLNLTNVNAVTSGFLSQLAVGCPNLTSLNLSGCQSSVDTLEGIQALATHCSALKHLNLTQIHYHGRNPHLKTNELLSALSGMHQITSLALSVCCVSSTAKSAKSSSVDGKVSGIFTDVGNGSRDSEAERSPSACASASQSVASSFAGFTNSFKGMKQFELIAVNFESLLTKEVVVRSNKLRENHCPLPESHVLKHLVNWKYLEDLTLAGLPLAVSLNSLVSVTRTCTELKYLSLAHLGSLQHSSAVAALCKALSHCSKLQLFRLEQFYLNITPALVSSLHNAKKLERVYILSKHGNLDSTLLFDWFEKCPKLTVLQIFVGNLSVNAGKTITGNLMSRYSAKRPSLCVLVHPYKDINGLLEVVSRHTPTVHFEELTLFSSKVAKFDRQ